MATQPELISVSLAWRDQEYHYSPLDGIIVQCKVTPPPPHPPEFYLNGERHCKSKVFCQRTQHNDPGRVQTQASHSLFDFKRIWLISSYFWAKTPITIKEKHLSHNQKFKTFTFCTLVSASSDGICSAFSSFPFSMTCCFASSPVPWEPPSTVGCFKLSEEIHLANF